MIQIIENLNDSSKIQIGSLIDFLYQQKIKYDKINKIQKTLNLVYILNLKTSSFINEIKNCLKKDLDNNENFLKNKKKYFLNDIFKEKSIVFNDELSKTNSIFDITEKNKKIKSEISSEKNFLEEISNFDLFKKKDSFFENQKTNFSENIQIEENVKKEYFSENESDINFENNSIILNNKKSDKKIIDKKLIEKLYIKNLEKNFQKKIKIKIEEENNFLKFPEIIKEEFFYIKKKKKIKRLKRGKYKIVSLLKKKEAVTLCKILSIKKTSEYLKISEKNIKRWLINGIERKKGAGRKIRDLKMENDLKLWMKNEFERVGKFPNYFFVKKQAKIFSNCEKFKASKGWCDKFFRRNFKFMQDIRCNVEKF